MKKILLERKKEILLEKMIKYIINDILNCQNIIVLFLQFYNKLRSDDFTTQLIVEL